MDGRDGSTRRRAFLVRALVVVGGLLAGLGLLAGYLNHELFDAPSFADHVDAIRRDEDVAVVLGQHISDEIIKANPDLVAIRPLIQQVATQVAGGDLLERPTRTAALTAYRALVDDEGPLTVRIADLATVIGAVVARVAPDLAPVATDISVTLVSVGGGPFQDAVSALARAIDTLSRALPLAAVACFAGAIALSRRRWRTAGSIGRTLVAVAVVLALLLVVGGFVVRQLDHDTLGGAVAIAAWRTLIRPFWWLVAGLGAVGLSVWLSCDSSASATLATRREMMAAAVRSGRPLAVVGRTIGALALGIAAIVDPGGTVELVATVAGVGLVLYAAAQVAEVAGRARAADESEREIGGTAESRPTRSRLVRYGAVGAAVLLLLGGLAWLARPGRGALAVDAQPPPSGACNGHVELCDRPFDEVAYVASHNAMSVANLPGWFLAEQIDPIPDQLDQGVRALLIDVWPGIPAVSAVRTAPEANQEALAVAEAELGPEAVAAAQRIANSVVGEPTGAEARFMCHGLCETGSTPFAETLDQLRAWLVVNPDEVVTMFIEDHVDASLIAADVEAAGLLPFVYGPTAGEDWPTLGEMIESGRRLVVMVEEGDGGEDAPWLVNGFEYTQDTPYTFPTVEDFSCAPNRGPSDAPLLLLNHWLSGFSSLVSSAQEVNQREVLLARAEQCEQERGQIPNFVAVNFVAIGDVFEVVDVLNGVAA